MNEVLKHLPGSKKAKVFPPPTIVTVSGENAATHASWLAGEKNAEDERQLNVDRRKKLKNTAGLDDHLATQ